MYFHPNIRKNLILFVLSIALVCTVFSKYLLSMCLIGMVSFIFFLPVRYNKVSLGFNTEILRMEHYRKMWPFTGFLLYFLWIVLSIFWSQDTTTWFHDVLSKLGIVGIAFIFIFIPRVSPKGLVWLHSVFYFTLLAALVLVAMVYLPDFQDITLRIGRGRPIPTPIDHIRFSMMIAYASISAFGLILTTHPHRKMKRALFVFGLLFFATCHVLAVRSGLLLLYSGIGIILFYYIFYTKKYTLGLLGIGLVFLLPVIAYNTIESFRNKVYYSKHDLQQLFQNKGDNYSDGDRLRSIKNGISLWKESPVIGLGAGDYKNEMNRFYTQHDEGKKALLPHNQFIRSGMAYGWIGLFFLLLGFMWAIFKNKGYKKLLLLLILQCFFFSLFVEASMERYYALVFFFLFIGINALSED